MKLPQGYEKIIDSAINGKWHLLATRSDAPILPLWLKFPALNGILAKKLYRTHIPSFVVWENGTVKVYFEGAGFRASILSVSKLLFEPKKAREHIRKIIALCKQVAQKAKVFQTDELGSISTGLLFAHYKKITEFYSKSFLYGYITWCAQVLQWHLLSLLKQKTDILAKLGVTEEAAFGILVKSEHISPYNQKEKALDQLAIKYQLQLVQQKVTVETIKDTFPQIHKSIQSFLFRYNWVGYDYGGPALSYEEVLAQLKERPLGSKKQTFSKRTLLKKCGFTKQARTLFEIFSLISASKDFRNSADDFVHFCLDNFFREIGKRHGLSSELARSLWPNELEALIKGRKNYTASYIEQKREFCVGLVIGKKETFWIGLEAREAARKILGEGDISFKQSFLKGMSASSGIVRGAVRLVGSFADMDKVKSGDILVTNMTSPRFMAAIIRAGAIVTDEGGLTCHAAIIARELKKPCIIGTKIATKIFKDGMTVEVDANKGVVTILK
jgi:phosphohistidine swiveling domain-containing protein